MRFGVSSRLYVGRLGVEGVAIVYNSNSTVEEVGGGVRSCGTEIKLNS